MEIPICAVILAAGTSSRMGKPKQLLPLNDKPLLQHSIINCVDAGFEKVLVVVGSHAEEVRAAIDIEQGRIQWVGNDEYQKGQSTSLQMAVKELRGEFQSFMVFLGDQPFIRPKTIKRIYQMGMDHFERLKEPFVVQPLYKGKPGHPVFFGHFNEGTLNKVKGDQGAKNLISSSSHKLRIEIDDPFIVFDVDSPADYRTALKISGEFFVCD